MSGYKRNVAVGATILVAFALLGWMVLQFSDVPIRAFMKPQMPIEFHASGAEGISQGSPVLYLGVGVGRVTAVRRSADDLSVIIEAMVDEQPPLPANVEGVIRTQLLGGGSTISLVLVAGEVPATQEATAPSTGPLVPRGRLRPGQTLPARYVGVDILPPEVSMLARDLGSTSQELRKLAVKMRESNLVEKLVATVDALHRDVSKAGDVLEKVDTLVGDPKMRQNIHEAVANFREVSETARRIGTNIEKLSADAQTRMDRLADRGEQVLETTQSSVEGLSKQLTERLAQAAKIFGELEKASAKLNKGDGTAGKLLNDPALYEELLDVSKELKSTLRDIRRTVQGWEEEGLPLRVR